MKRKKEILVTGGAGFIGSHAVVELIENGFEPIIVDDFRNSDDLIIEGIERIIQRKIKVYRIDLMDYSKVKEVFKLHQFCGVIHFAAYKAVGESVDFPIKYYRNNLSTLLNVVELALEFKVFEFIFSSSCTLYEVPEDCAAVSEETPLCEPISPYASTKKMGERMLNDIAKSNPRLKLLFLRYFNPVGAHFSGHIGELPQGRPNNLFPYITQTATGKLKGLTVFGNDYDTTDGTCIRDYIHVSDIAEAHALGLKWLMKQLPNTKEIINLGTGQGKSVTEIISLFESVTSEKLNWKYGPRREGDREQIFANAQKARNLLGWAAQRSIEEAISDAWRWENNLSSLSSITIQNKEAS